MDEPCSYYEPKNRENYPHGKGFCYVIANFCGNKINDHVQIYRDSDVSKIRKFFEGKLEYKFKESKNLSKEKFFEKLKEIKSSLNDEAHRHIDRFFLFILSHGSEKGVNMCSDSEGTQLEKDDSGKGVYVTVDEISSYFDHGSIPSLKGHPKCIFIHACRGLDIAQVACDIEKNLPGTHLIADPAENLNTEEISSDQIKDDEDITNVENGTSSVQVKRPSSENMLVAFSCIKGTVTFLNSEATYIEVVMSTLEENYRKEHLLDMMVDITRKIGGIKFKYYIPLIYKMDSARELILIGNDGSENKSYIVGLDGSRVYQFEGHRGTVQEMELKVEEKHDIECEMEYNGNDYHSKLQLEKLPVKVINTILSNENVSLVDSVDCYLFSNGKTIGVGKLKIKNNTVDTVAKRVIKYEGNFAYAGKFFECANGNDTVDLLGRPCKIMEPYSHCGDKKLIAEGTIRDRYGVPVLETGVSQLPIFETTLTKKFFLWKNVNDSKRTSSGQPVAEVTNTMDGMQMNIHQAGQHITDHARKVSMYADYVKLLMMEIHPSRWMEFSVKIPEFIYNFNMPQQLRQLQPSHQQQSQPVQQQYSTPIQFTQPFQITSMVENMTMNSAAFPEGSQ